MAISHTPLHTPIPLPPEIQRVHSIQGTALYAEHRVNASQLLTMNATQAKQLEDSMKSDLCQKLVREMFESDCIEFTKSIDNYSGNYVFRARSFVVPKADVQILRTSGNIR